VYVCYNDIVLIGGETD